MSVDERARRHARGLRCAAAEAMRMGQRLSAAELTLTTSRRGHMIVLCRLFCCCCFFLRSGDRDGSQGQQPGCSAVHRGDRHGRRRHCFVRRVPGHVAEDRAERDGQEHAQGIIVSLLFLPACLSFLFRFVSSPTPICSPFFFLRTRRPVPSRRVSRAHPHPHSLTLFPPSRFSPSARHLAAFTVTPHAPLLPTHPSTHLLSLQPSASGRLLSPSQSHSIRHTQLLPLFASVFRP